MERVVQFGVLAPLVVRPWKQGGYKMISALPVMDNDQAVVQMGDRNLQCESILPGGRAFACKMKLEAIKSKVPVQL